MLKGAAERRAQTTRQSGLPDPEILEAAVELGPLPSRINKTLRPPRPGWVRLRIDIQLHGIARRTPSGTRGISRPVRHHDFYFVIIRVNIFLHRNSPVKERVL